MRRTSMPLYHKTGFNRGWEYEVLMKDGRRMVKRVYAQSAWYGLLKVRELFLSQAKDVKEIFVRGLVPENGRVG